MRQREFAQTLASLPAGAPRPPSPAEPTIATLLAKRAIRFSPGAWSAWHDGLRERAALRCTEQQQTRSMTSRKRFRDPLPTLLAESWPPCARERFLREDALRSAFVAASRQREKGVFTEQELFDRRHSELGERTLFSAFSALCQGMDLLNVVSVLRGGKDAIARASACLAAMRSPKRSKTAGSGSGRRRGHELRVERLLGRGLTILCESFLENDRLFGGGANIGDMLDVVLIPKDARRRDGETVRVMVVEVHSHDAQVDLAEMVALPVPVGAAAGAAASQQHAFTGVVRRLDLCQFAHAREAAATGGGEGGGGEAGLRAFGLGAAARPSQNDEVARLGPESTVVDKPGVYGEKGFQFRV